MKATHVSLRPAAAAEAAGRPALTPELLAASGARYSRNNEGLELILERIDPNNLDRSVDSIFKMIDYGHQSIADMAPVAMFIDGVSIWLAYLIWSVCPTAGGQESSTRYVRYGIGADSDADQYGIPIGLQDKWKRLRREAFQAFELALARWEELGAARPGLLRLPDSLLNDDSGRARKQVARMRRNFGFDRARYFLPAATPTNLMLVMSARGWTQLCQFLSSQMLPEARAVGAAIRDELVFATPRLIKHAGAKRSTEEGIRAEFAALRSSAMETPAPELSGEANSVTSPPTAYLRLFPPDDHNANASEDLRFHDNRYAWIGAGLQRVGVRFGWQAVALAEIRDLNRHRTGSKYCPPVPRGFYFADDEAPANDPELMEALNSLSAVGREASACALDLLRGGDPTYVYWSLLGTQFRFEHLTTADKFLYEAELRTGSGAHFRYARHLRDALALWYDAYPETRGLVLEGAAEPE